MFQILGRTKIENVAVFKGTEGVSHNTQCYIKLHLGIELIYCRKVFLEYYFDFN